MLDTANPRVPLLEAMIRISDAVPTLRIVLDHLPALDPAEADRGAYDAALQELGSARRSSSSSRRSFTA